MTSRDPLRITGRFFDDFNRTPDSHTEHHMALKITFHGHSTFTLSDGSSKVLIDPFFTGNPQAKVAADDISCSHVLLSHGHEDHMSDAVSIASRCDATVHATFEITSALEREGLSKTEPANAGGRVKTVFGSVSFTPAFHSSSFNGEYMGMPLGIIIEIGTHTVYFTGDTSLFSDMKLIKELYTPDVLILPIGDRFTMGPEHGTIAADWIGADVTIPCHYGTWPLIDADVSRFTPQNTRVEMLQPEESLDIASK